MTLNPDGTVSLPAMTLTTNQVDELIAALASMRADMSPAVSNAWALTDNITSMADPSVRVGLIAENRVLMALRHSGLGWLCFDFDMARASALRDYFAKRTAGVNSQLFEDNADQGKPPH
jgi:hypothetical protein